MSTTKNTWIKELYQWADENGIPDYYYIEGDDELLDEKGEPIFEGFWVGLPRDAEQLLQLEELDLGWHDVNYIPEQLKYLTQLKVLRFDKYRYDVIPPHFPGLKTVNQINEIPTWIDRLHNLEELSLCNNAIRHIPEAVTRLSNLKKLYLRDNLLKQFNAHEQALQNLEILWLDGNAIEEVPSFVYNLKRLKQLNLHYNKLSFISDKLNDLKDLELLDIGNNRLTDIPDISRLHLLKFFDYSDNNIRLM